MAASLAYLAPHHVHVLGVGVDVVAEEQEQFGAGGQRPRPRSAGAAPGSRTSRRRSGGAARRGGGVSPAGRITSAIGRAAAGRVGVVVLAEQGRERRGHLALGDGLGSARSPSAGVSGPRTASQIASEPFVFSPWSRQPRGGSPRPWSVVTISVVVPRYCGCDCSSSQSSLEVRVGVVGGPEVLVVTAAVGVLVGVAQADVEAPAACRAGGAPGRPGR